MYQHISLIVVTCSLLLGCGNNPQNNHNMSIDMVEQEDMAAPPKDMTNLVMIDETCRQLYSNILLNCKPTVDEKSTECTAPLAAYQNCSTLCGADVTCQTGTDQLKVSGYYQEPGNIDRNLVIKISPFMKIKGVSKDDSLYSASFSGNAKSNYFSVYYTKKYREKEQSPFSYDIVVVTAKSDGTCPNKKLFDIKSRTITLRNIPDSVPTDIFEMPVVGDATTTVWPKDWTRNTAQDDADPPVCP